MMTETVTLVNRTKGELKVTFDGTDIPIKPGPNYGFPAVAVPYAKGQNRVNGTTHPFSPSTFVSLVGVDGIDDTSPLEQSDEIELYDRSKFGGLASEAVRVPGQPVTAWEARTGMGDIDGAAVSDR